MSVVCTAPGRGLFLYAAAGHSDLMAGGGAGAAARAGGGASVDTIRIDSATSALGNTSSRHSHRRESGWYRTRPSRNCMPVNSRSRLIEPSAMDGAPRRAAAMGAALPVPGHIELAIPVRHRQFERQRRLVGSLRDTSVDGEEAAGAHGQQKRRKGRERRRGGSGRPRGRGRSPPVFRMDNAGTHRGGLVPFQRRAGLGLGRLGGRARAALGLRLARRR